MNLMRELIDAYLDYNFEHAYYLDLDTGEVILDMDETYTGELGIDWDDEENEDKYICIPKIDSNEAFRVMESFSQSTQFDPKGRLFDALRGNKPFRRFKDMLYELNMWEEWNNFQNKYAEKEIQSWMEETELNFNELNEKHQTNHTFYTENATKSIVH